MALVIASAVAVVTCCFTAHVIWPHEWTITKPWALPEELSRGFTLLTPPTIPALTLDPLVFDHSEGEDKYWRMAREKEDYFLFITEGVGEVGIMFLAGTPPLGWEETIHPFSVGDWRGKFSPAETVLNRKDMTLDIKYVFDPSPLTWVLLTFEGLATVAFLLCVYGIKVRPHHIAFAESLGGSS